MPTPSGLPTRTDFQNATLDVAHLGRVVNSKDSSGAPITTSTNRTGGVNKTLDALETEYTEAIRNAGGQPLGDGTWQAGQTFTAYNKFMVYNGIAYKPLTTTTLPYGPTGATPDLAFVGPFSDVTDADITIAQGELIGGGVFPSSGDLAVGMTVPIGTTHLRVDGAIYAMSPIATGSVTAVTSTSATIGGVSVYISPQFSWTKQEFESFLGGKLLKAAKIGDVISEPCLYIGLQGSTYCMGEEVSGAIDSVNLIGKPYTITVSGVSHYLQNPAYFRKGESVLKAFFPVADEVTPDTASLQAMIDYAKKTKYPCTVHSGKYITTQNLKIEWDGFSILGIGGRDSCEIISATTEPAMSWDGTLKGDYLTDLSMFNIKISGDWDKTAHTGTTGYGLYLFKVGNGTYIENSKFNQNNYGIYGVDSFGVTLNNVMCQWNGNNGLYTRTSSNRWSCIGCEFNFNGKQGARVGGQGNTLLGCNYEGNEEDQVELFGRGNTILGGYIEKPAAPPFAMVKLNGATGWSVSGLFINELGGKPLDPGQKYTFLLVTGGSQQGELGKCTDMSDPGGLTNHVVVDDGQNNVFYLEEDENFINNSSATNKVLYTTRMTNSRGGIASVADGGTITHNVGVLPERWSLEPINATPIKVQVTARTTTTFTVLVQDSAGNPMTSPRNISWNVWY